MMCRFLLLLSLLAAFISTALTAYTCEGDELCLECNEETHQCDTCDVGYQAQDVGCLLMCKFNGQDVVTTADSCTEAVKSQCSNTYLEDEDGDPCVFPFTYNNKQYTECTEVDSPGKPWCSTKSQYDGSYVNCGTKIKGGTAKEGVCKFPFIYRGRVFNECTLYRHDQLWCSTTTDYEGKWGNCGTRSYGGTGNNATCVFPFKYQSHTRTYRGCSHRKHTQWWCLTSKGLFTNTWGNCAEAGCDHYWINE